MGIPLRVADPQLQATAEPMQARQSVMPWWPVAAGLAALYVPTYIDLFRMFWVSGRSGHGPVILALVAWLIWRRRELLAARHQAPVSPGFVGSFVFGLLCYMVGRSQAVLQLEVVSQLPLLLGVAGLMLGGQAARQLCFPIAFLLFLVPVPGTLLDELLMPLKHLVSAIADATLYAVGYPIARNGVMLMIGPYDLLIADACSGLNSMVALSGVGLIYTYVAGAKPIWRSALLLTSVLPIAFVSNVVRVLVLLLVTYHFGDGPGRAFHTWAAYLEMAMAFASLFCVDRMTGWIAERSSRSRRQASQPEPAS